MGHMPKAHPPLSHMKKHGYKGPRQLRGAGLGGFRNAKRFGGGEHEGMRGAKRPHASPMKPPSIGVPRPTPK